LTIRQRPADSKMRPDRLSRIGALDDADYGFDEIDAYMLTQPGRQNPARQHGHRKYTMGASILKNILGLMTYRLQRGVRQ